MPYRLTSASPSASIRANTSLNDQRSSSYTRKISSPPSRARSNMLRRFGGACLNRRSPRSSSTSSNGDPGPLTRAAASCQVNATLATLTLASGQQKYVCASDAVVDHGFARANPICRAVTRSVVAATVAGVVVEVVAGAVVVAGTVAAVVVDRVVRGIDTVVVDRVLRGVDAVV